LDPRYPWQGAAQGWPPAYSQEPREHLAAPASEGTGVHLLPAAPWRRRLGICVAASGDARGPRGLVPALFEAVQGVPGHHPAQLDQLRRALELEEPAQPLGHLEHHIRWVAGNLVARQD